MSNKIELRSIDNQGVEEIWVDGYASVFNQISKQLVDASGKFFFEIIEAGAFDEVLKINPNVVMNYNHSNEQILARTVSGTLQLSVDDYGLRFSFRMPDTQLGRDLTELIKRGDIYECSFAFVPDKQSTTFTKQPDGTILRRIHKVIGLYDCSLVVDGAYANTTISLRDYDEMESQLVEQESEPVNNPNELEILELTIKILKFK